jgi:ribonuclease BN (tRNA processing enzyme)
MSQAEKEAIIWAYHLKPRELAELASQANVRTLVLIHESNYSSPYDSEALLEEIKRFYRGEVHSSRDGDIF